MKPTLLVLAAGMGSRYGGLKQLDGVGPHGETIMDYSVYDAKRAGFGKVVFVIRHDFEKDFTQKILSKYRDFIPVEVVFQDLDALPEGYTCPEGRKRPWGTNHAIMMAASKIAEPFGVINADDFYGYDAFRVLAEQLSKCEGNPGNYCMVSFKVSNTMSKNGSVSRGVCTVDSKKRLRRVIERRKIAWEPDGSISFINDADGSKHTLDADTPVSMNTWGFTPDYFAYAEREFRLFLDKYGQTDDREFFIPSVVDKLVGNREATVTVVPTDSRWFGVTYSEDRPGVVESLAALHASGQYPESMFGQFYF